MKTLRVILLLGVVGVVVIIALRPPVPIEPAGQPRPAVAAPPLASGGQSTNASVSAGLRGLDVIALAQEYYSVKGGGAGLKHFSSTFAGLTNQLNWQYHSALVQATGWTGHMEGYQFELTKHPESDFAGNYVAIARPAPGFVGPELRIDKRRVAWTNEVSAKASARTNSPPPQPSTP